MPKEPLVIEDILASKDGQRLLRLTGPLVLTTRFDFQVKVRADNWRTTCCRISAICLTWIRLASAGSPALRSRIRKTDAARKAAHQGRAQGHLRQLFTSSNRWPPPSRPASNPSVCNNKGGSKGRPLANGCKWFTPV
jgi:hypothetical protein